MLTDVKGAVFVRISGFLNTLATSSIPALLPTTVNLWFD